MHLKSAIVVKRSIKEVTDFFYEPTSLAKWDRSVATLVLTSSTTSGVGTIFDTISPSGMKMSYEIVEFDPERSVKVLLTKSKIFKKAIWHFQFDPIPEGIQITCHVHFIVRPSYLLLYPVLYFTKKALTRDLNYLKVALDKCYTK